MNNKLKFFVVFILAIANLHLLQAKIITYRDEKGRIVARNVPGSIPRKVVNRKYTNSYNVLIERIGRKYGVPPSLIHQIILVESGYNSLAVSPKGAMGLMQLMPATAKQYGVKDPFDPAQNIEGGVRYLKDLIKLYKGNTDLILAAYNAGQEAVEEYGGIPPYQETIKYIEKIKRSFRKSYIRTKTKIYRYYDSNGRLIITDKPPLPNQVKGKVKVVN
jgi:soluble lytic murein transglycosylase-like protein